MTLQRNFPKFTSIQIDKAKKVYAHGLCCKWLIFRISSKNYIE